MALFAEGGTRTGRIYRVIRSPDIASVINIWPKIYEPTSYRDDNELNWSNRLSGKAFRPATTQSPPGLFSALRPRTVPVRGIRQSGPLLAGPHSTAERSVNRLFQNGMCVTMQASATNMPTFHICQHILLRSLCLSKQTYFYLLCEMLEHSRQFPLIELVKQQVGYILTTCEYCCEWHSIVFVFA